MNYVTNFPLAIGFDVNYTLSRGRFLLIAVKDINQRSLEEAVVVRISPDTIWNSEKYQLRLLYTHDQMKYIM